MSEFIGENHGTQSGCAEVEEHVDKSYGPSMSKNAVKRQAKAERKAQKFAYAKQAAEIYVTEHNLVRQSTVPSASNASGGKVGRAKAFALTGDVSTAPSGHRAAGGEPIDVKPEHAALVEMLEDLEKHERVKGCPGLFHRRPVPVDVHGTMETALPPETTGEAAISTALRNLNIHEFSVTLLGLSLGNIVSLDLSRNSISEAPGLEAMGRLAQLNLDRNWFESLPTNLHKLPHLVSLSAQHNMLKGNEASLQIDCLASCKPFSLLDLQFNKSCSSQNLLMSCRESLGSKVTIKMTITHINGASAEGNYVGASPAERDACELRSQLEPWSTTALRRRLVADFGIDPLHLDPETVPRSKVVNELLSCYKKEGITGLNRKTVHVDGTLVDRPIIDALLLELRAWADTTAQTGKGRERPTISARKYMILTSPAEFQSGSFLSLKAVAKLQAHSKIWDLAIEALKTVDPEFAETFTAVAVTHQFVGSPHIDKRNVGPFYGLALGGFTADDGGSGGGGIMVESSARVVAYVNTANRLGKVDGRNPHWVAPYSESEERFSLIYYKTAGNYLAPGPAVFSMPSAGATVGPAVSP